MKEKEEIRKRIRQKRLQMQQDFFLKAGVCMSKTVQQMPDYEKAKTIFCYLSTSKEPDTKNLIEQAWAQGKHVLVPRCCQNGVMQAVEITSFQQLEKHEKHHFLQPGFHLASAAYEEIDFCIVPCMAMAKDGTRLGYGGGYYDRFLKNLSKDVKCVVFCCEAFVYHTLPKQEHDVLFPDFITEKGLISCFKEPESK